MRLKACILFIAGIMLCGLAHADWSGFTRFLDSLTNNEKEVAEASVNWQDIQMIKVEVKDEESKSISGVSAD